VDVERVDDGEQDRDDGDAAQPRHHAHDGAADDPGQEEQQPDRVEERPERLERRV
jgi:hypothetical protein